MTPRENILALIYGCLERLNKERDASRQIVISETTALLNDDSQLDSLDVVAFSVDLEEKIRRMAGREIELSPANLQEGQHPLRNVTTLVEYILTKM